MDPLGLGRGRSNQITFRDLHLIPRALALPSQFASDVPYVADGKLHVDSDPRYDFLAIFLPWGIQVGGSSSYIKTLIRLLQW